MMTGKKIGGPEVYAAEEIVSCEICIEPEFTKEELERKVCHKEDGRIQSLKVCIWLLKEKQPVEIGLISSGARIKSYAFRHSYHFAKRIEEGVIRVLERE